MTDPARPRLLWPVAISGTAALLATLGTRLAALPWMVHFGCDVIVLSTICGLAWKISRKRTPTPGVMPSLAETSKRELPPELLSVARHEMKTPLAGIKAYVELLADGDADDEAVRVEFLIGIGSQVERLERAIDGLLATSPSNR